MAKKKPAKKPAKKPTRVKGGTRPPDQVLTPAGTMPAASLPTFRPITFGRPVSNVPYDPTPQPLAKQVAGSRAALAFVQSLEGTT
jgi:hypothetical protein